VTIIVGIKCSAAIVLASDSQTTYGDDSKRCDAEKIRVVPFKGDDKALVAQSGTVETSSRVIDVMTRLACTRDLESEETVIKTAQEAIWEVRGELRRQHFDCSAEEFRDIIFSEGLDCSLMVAHFFKHVPFIHVFNLQGGTTNTSKTDYESVGCGSALANYLLGELAAKDMDYNFGKALAVYVVDKTIQNVAHCDKPIRLAVLYPWKPDYFPPRNPLDPAKDHLSIFTDNVAVLDLKEVKEIEEKVARIDEETKQHRVEKLKSSLLSYAYTMPKFPNYGINSPSDSGDPCGLDDLYK
jgi:20S proteasome alpha/beta subunit